jgi:hypothetical protein
MAAGEGEGKDGKKTPWRKEKSESRLRQVQPIRQGKSCMWLGLRKRTNYD